MCQSKRLGTLFSVTASFLLTSAYAASGEVPGTNTAAKPPIRFSVVSVKQNVSDDQRMSYSAPKNGDSVSYTNYPLFYVVIYSNDFHRQDLVSGLPEWTKSERYDIVAKVAPEDVETYHALPLQERQAMFQEVLSERFRLRFHLEPKEVPALEMTVAKGGPKLKSPDPATPLGLRAKYGQSILLVSRGVIEAESATTTDLAMFLTAIHPGKQIVDRTGLAGKYDFTIRFAPESDAGPSPGEAGSVSSESSAPELSTALREQLGIQLRPGKAVMDSFVVDHIQHPAPN